MTTAVDRNVHIGVLDPDVYANGNPDTFGLPLDQYAYFNWVDHFAAPFDPRISPSFETVMEAIFKLTAYAGELAARKRGLPADDVVTQMVHADRADTMSEDEILGNIVLLASGAAESTRTALSHAMHQLMREPDQMAWLREHSNNIPDTAIQEMVRVATPFLHFVRTVTKDIELHGKSIAAGDRVCMLLGAGNFDPTVFRDAESFDLTRTPNRHLSFGRGPHSCLGKHIAVLEMKILLEELLQRTKQIKPAGSISYVRDVFSRGVYELPVTVTPA